MFILSSFFRVLEVWPVNHISIYEQSESKDFKDTEFLFEISNN